MYVFYNVGYAFCETFAKTKTVWLDIRSMMYYISDDELDREYVNPKFSKPIPWKKELVTVAIKLTKSNLINKVIIIDNCKWNIRIRKN